MSKRRVKVSDLLKVAERAFPTVVYVQKPEPAWWRSEKEYPLEVLHISKREGNFNRRSYAVTECNRALEWPEWFRDNFLSEDLEARGYKLCPRCGAREDFDGVLEARSKAQAEVNAKHAERERQKRIEREAHWASVKTQIANLRTALVEAGFVTDFQNEYSLTITTDWATFEVELKSLL